MGKSRFLQGEDLCEVDGYVGTPNWKEPVVSTYFDLLTDIQYGVHTKENDVAKDDNGVL